MKGGRRSAVVVGAGIAGLSAAHELAERGYEVDVYESAWVVGGLAASHHALPDVSRSRAQMQPCVRPEPTRQRLALAVSQDGRVVLGGSLGLGLWFGESGQQLWVGGADLDALGEVEALAMDAEGRRGVFVLQGERRVGLLDVRRRERVGVLELGSEVRALAVSPDGAWLWVGEASGAVSRWDLGALWDEPSSAAALWRWEGAEPVARLALSGGWAAWGDAKGGLWLRGPQGAAREVRRGRGAALSALSFVGEGLVAAWEDGAVLGWALGEGGLVGEAVALVRGRAGSERLAAVSRAVATAAAGSPSGGCLVVGFSDGSLRRWAVETSGGQWASRLEHRWEGHEGRVTGLAFVGEGRVWAGSRSFGGKDHAIKLWDAEWGACVRAMEAHGLKPLPGEHGFRFFPSFYRHLSDSMRRTYVDEAGTRTALENLLPTYLQGIALEDGMYAHDFERAPALSLPKVMALARDLLVGMGHDVRDAALFLTKCAEFLCACEGRRREYEDVSWWEFVKGDVYSKGFQHFLISVPQALVALNAKKADARTQGIILIQLLRDQFVKGDNTDRLLNNPTSEAWLWPWEDHLRRLGVRFHFGHRLERLVLERDSGTPEGWRAAALRLRDGFGEELEVPIERAVLALPVRAAHGALTRTQEAHPAWTPKGDVARILGFPLQESLGHIGGVQYFLSQDASILPGHLFFPRAPWGLSVVSQAQFWREPRRQGLAKHHGVRGVYSAIMADWDAKTSSAERPDPRKPWERSEVHGRTAREVAQERRDDRFAREVWRQLQHALEGKPPAPYRDVLERGQLPTPRYFYMEPLEAMDGAYLLNRVKDWRSRPGWDGAAKCDEAGLKGYGVQLGAVVFAGNHMKTTTRLSTMESANESARHAVNALLRADGFEGELCELWPLEDWEVSSAEPLKGIDEELYRQGRPSLIEALGVFEALQGVFPKNAARDIEAWLEPSACGPLREALEALGLPRGASEALFERALPQERRRAQAPVSASTRAWRAAATGKPKKRKGGRFWRRGGPSE